ncbi:SulP family inorganic anion transporter [Paracoccus sp. (in: a-proteobacteria)]|uniref:SulP family inorganic anion transporter n=1 Tax=Paracoccus sp. TaxID=267 RepID=UPI00396CBAB1
MRPLTSCFPALEWGRRYSWPTFLSDGMAAVVVTMMLIPQALAYAMLAGLPPVVGLYASILPMVVYALFGSSSTMSVGPVAIVSLLTATAAGAVAPAGSAAYLTAALTLALLSGLMLVTMSIFRLGFVTNLLSHPVISGLITGSALLISAGQLKHILGVEAHGQTLIEVVHSLLRSLPQSNFPSLFLGATAIVFLFWSRAKMRALLQHLGVPAGAAVVIARSGPVLAVTASILIVIWLDLSSRGVAVVGNIPQGLPPLSLPALDLTTWRMLLPAAFLISIIGFVESVSVAQTLAAKRRQSIRPDRELMGLGMANLAAAFTGGYPVSGGLARSVVNFDAGAQTPAAGIYTALGIALASVFLTPVLFYLPIAVLAATIIVAVMSLADFGALRRTWIYSRFDFSSLAATLVFTLALGVEKGILIGIAISVLLHLWRSSRPHVAVLGQVPGTHHFRNVLRHDVVCVPDVLSLRIDESLFFGNARAIEDVIQQAVADRPQVRHVVLNCAAVNGIDASALESLELIMHRLEDASIRLHLSEVKGPVMDRLGSTDFLCHLSGNVFLSHHAALEALAPASTRAAGAGKLA